MSVEKHLNLELIVLIVIHILCRFAGVGADDNFVILVVKMVHGRCLRSVSSYSTSPDHTSPDGRIHLAVYHFHNKDNKYIISYSHSANGFIILVKIRGEIV